MMIQAVLGNPHHPEYGVATIPFPIPRDQYAHCMQPTPCGARSSATMIPLWILCRPIVGAPASAHLLPPMQRRWN